MRLLHPRHPDERGGAACGKTRPLQPTRSSRHLTAISAAAARITASCAPCCARQARWPRHERALPAQTAGQPCGKPKAFVMAEVLARRACRRCRRARSRSAKASSPRWRKLPPMSSTSTSPGCRWSAPPLPQAPTKASRPAASRSSNPAARCATSAPKCGAFSSKAASDRLGVRHRCARHRGRHNLADPAMCSTSYWELADEVSLDRDATPARRRSRQRGARWPVSPCSASTFPTRCLRRPRFIQDAALPGTAAWTGAAAGTVRSASCESERDAARAVAGLVAVVRDGSFAGVVCESEHGAESALKALRKGATWSAAKHCRTRTTSRRS